MLLRITTVFDAAATIYSVTQSCAATIRERRLSNSEVYCHCRDRGARPLCDIDEDENELEENEVVLEDC